MSSTPRRASAPTLAGYWWESLEDHRKLLDFLEFLAGTDALGLLHVGWSGCPACRIGAFADAIQQVQHDFESEDWVFARSIPWRTNDDTLLRYPVARSYKLFDALTLGRRQFYGGGRLVENYSSNLPNWRPRFPQMFFMDGRQIDSTYLRQLRTLDDGGELFYPLGPDPSDPDKFLSGDLQLAAFNGQLNHAVYDSIQGAFGNDAVLLQLTNENLYRQPGDADEDFMADEFHETIDCVAKQFAEDPIYSTICFRFERPESY